MKNRTKLIIGCLLFVIGLYVSGCGKDSDAVVVDFSKTVAVERPKSPTPESAQLKVAVAAIISPKETFIYYRQLLDYIGNKMAGQKPN
jgi:phosphonate transport system substrate-binding protein